MIGCLLYIIIISFLLLNFMYILHIHLNLHVQYVVLTIYILLDITGYIVSALKKIITAKNYDLIRIYFLITQWIRIQRNSGLVVVLLAVPNNIK